jgi:hypothetical protein
MDENTEGRVCDAIRVPIPGVRFSMTHYCCRESKHFGYHECGVCGINWLEPASNKQEGDSNEVQDL